MKSSLEGKCRLTAALLGLIMAALPPLAGCKKKATALTPVPVEQVPATMQQSFQQAPPEIRQSANEVVAAVEKGDEPHALVELQHLASRPELTQQQRDAAVRSWMAVHERLRAAAAKGDKRAEDALEHYRATK